MTTEANIPQMAKDLQERIMHLSHLQPSECGCKECQTMCKTAPCLGTPLDMYVLSAFPELAEKVALTMNLAAVRFGLPPIAMYAPIFDEEKGACSFFENGKCTLHALGLKPLEGKLASCNPSNNLFDATKLIFQTWLPLQNELYLKFLEP